jgi:AraC-like DNA-binding protein
MNVPSPSHSTRGLAAIADRWGYGYEVSAAGDDDRPLASGVLSTMELPCGARFCANDLVSVRDNARTGIVPRSLTIILVLDGDPACYRLDSGDEVAVRPGCAIVIAAADDARLASRYRRGDRSRSLVLQASPDGMDDAALGEEIERRLEATAVTPLPVNDRLRMLAADLFAMPDAGPVARLLAESCALELLARGLAHEPRTEAAPAGPLHARDVARILRVRDKLLAEPAAEHRLCDLARLADMGVSSLKAKFPLVVGQPVFDFLRDQRLERARRGLEVEGWTVKQAAYFVGYAHPSNFATAYRRKFGSAPREARGI